MSTQASHPFVTPDVLLSHWQGHRRLTRRVIEAFPEDKLFTFSIGGMRTFGEMATELLAMPVPMVQGLVTGEWNAFAPTEVKTKSELLSRWDANTTELEELWPRLANAPFSETVTSFGQYTGPMYWQILYVIDNEIHHRAQGYVYLRALGIEPPPFWERD